MKKNTLYTVNKRNQPAFGNIFVGGGDKGGKSFWGDAFSKGNIKGTMGNIVGDLGGAVGGVIGNALRGGFDDGGIGSGIQNIGSTIGSAIPGPIGGIVSAGSGLIGGFFSRMFGVKENKENTGFIKSNTQNAFNVGNTLAASSTTGDLINNSGRMASNSGFKWSDLYQNGWFTSRGTRLGNNLIAKEKSALASQSHGLATGAENVDYNMDRNVMRNFAAFGGPLGYQSGGLGALGIMQQDAYFDAINNRSNALSSSPLLSSLGFGGELGTNGTDFTNGLLYIDEGGTHEANPLGGIPMGIDSQGVPNLVEEGETVYNDYVFSNRIKVPKSLYHEFGLGGVVNRKGITFAEASKKLAKESEQRPNDTISIDGLKESLSKLAAVQESERMKAAMEEYVGLNSYAYGGNLYGDGGTLKHNGETALEWLNKNYPNVGNKKALADALANIYKKKYVKTSEVKDALSGKTTKVNSPSQYASWGNAYRVLTHGSENMLRSRWSNGTIDEDKAGKHYKELLSYGLSPKVAFGIAYPQPDKPKEGYGASYAAKQAKAYEDATKRRNELYKEAMKDYTSQQKSAKPSTVAPPAKETTTDTVAPPKAPKAPNPNKETSQPVVKNRSGLPKSNVGAVEEPRIPLGFGEEGLKPIEPQESSYIFDWSKQPKTVYEELRETPAPWLPKKEPAPEPNNYVIDPNRSGETPAQPRNTDEYRPLPTWMMYAPLFNPFMFSSPDYSDAQRVEDAANRASEYLPASFSPIGNYMRFNPMDIMQEQNRLDANARATDRAIINTNNPAKMAGLIATGYNSQLAGADLFRKAQEYNDAKRMQVADYNRRTDMFNSQMGLEAAMANSRTRQQAENARLAGIEQAANMRDAIDARVSASNSANYSNALQNLANIGRMNFIMNQINGDDAWNYGIDRSGRTPFKKRKCGGNINRR